MFPALPRLLAAFLLLILCTTPVAAQSPTDPTGTWTGAIEVNALKLDVVIVLSIAPARGYEGTIDIPAQGIRKLALKDISATGSSVSFGIPSIPGDPKFSGTIAADGGTMSGTFLQGGGSFPFTLHRETAAARAETARATGVVLDSIRAIAAEAMKRFEVPGMAIAVVRKGEVIFTEGFGYRDQEKKLPATATTLFAIGSTTKAFTSFVLATLVDEGKLEWDAPVRRYLPEFDLKDRTAAEGMTPRDLLLHVSGLPRHDALWYGSTLGRQELFERLKYLESSTAFRRKWQYQNLMYMAAGYLAGHVAGSTWEDLVRSRILTPLGMNATNFSVADMERSQDAALPYEEREHDGKTALERVPYRNIDAVGPAGSINSNVVEMAQWVRLQLSDGTLNDKRLISEGELARLHRGQVVISDAPSPNKELLFTLYAMGWMVQSYRGHRVIHHDGNIDGFSALVSFMPQDSVGLVVLTNRGATPATAAMMLSIYDRLLGFEHTDWITRILQDAGKTGKTDKTETPEEEEEKPAPAPRVSGTEPSHPVADYAGEYEHPGYGVLTVHRNDDELAVEYHGMRAKLEHFHYDVFTVKNPDLPFHGVTLQFFGNQAGDIDEVRVPMEPSVSEIAFTRRVSAALSTPEALSPYAGEYELKGVTVTVRVQGTHLVVIIPGQPSYILVPYKENEFTFKDLKGYRVRFNRDGGRVVLLSFIQPNGVFEARRKI